MQELERVSKERMKLSMEVATLSASQGRVMILESELDGVRQASRSSVEIAEDRILELEGELRTLRVLCAAAFLPLIGCAGRAEEECT